MSASGVGGTSKRRKAVAAERARRNALKDAIPDIEPLGESSACARTTSPQQKTTKKTTDQLLN